MVSPQLNELHSHHNAVGDTRLMVLHNLLKMVAKIHSHDKTTSTKLTFLNYTNGVVGVDTA